MPLVASIENQYLVSCIQHATALLCHFRQFRPLLWKGCGLLGGEMRSSSISGSLTCFASCYHCAYRLI